MKTKCLDKPQKHDYPAAQAYLSLSLDDATAKAAAEQLEGADMTSFAATDIFRASGLSLLGVNDSHVKKDREQIIQKEKLSPSLFYRDNRNGKLIIADG